MDQGPDFSNATPFSTAQAFEEAATTVDDNGVQSYVPGRFVTRTGQRVPEMPLDTLTFVLMRMVMSLPSFQEEKDLGLMTASAIALGGQGSMEEKKDRARAALLRATCEHLVSATASDGTPLGGLRRTGAYIVLPFPPSLPDTPPSLTGKKRGPPSEIGAVSYTHLTLPTTSRV